jgi:hypothetical protein
MKMKLPKIPNEKYYTWVFVAILEISIIPICFGTLSAIMLTSA